MAKTLRQILRITPGSGWKVTVKYFKSTYSPLAMIGYTMKDHRQGWFNYARKGLSQKDLAKGRHDHLSVKQLHCHGREELDKRAFMYKIFWLLQHLPNPDATHGGADCALRAPLWPVHVRQFVGLRQRGSIDGH